MIGGMSTGIIYSGVANSELGIKYGSLIWTFHLNGSSIATEEKPLTILRVRIYPIFQWALEFTYVFTVAKAGVSIEQCGPRTAEAVCNSADTLVKHFTEGWIRVCAISHRAVHSFYNLIMSGAVLDGEGSN